MFAGDDDADNADALSLGEWEMVRRSLDKEDGQGRRRRRLASKDSSLEMESKPENILESDDHDAAAAAAGSAEILSSSLKNCPSRLLRSYPSNVDRLSAFLGREFPSLLPPSLSAALSPSAVAAVAAHAVVRIRDVDAATKKKSKLSFVVRSGALGGQRATLGCRDDGSSEGEARIFVETPEDTVEVEVTKGGERCLGRATFVLSSKLGEGRAKKPLRLTQGPVKVGSLALSVNLVNAENPTAVEVARRLVARQMISSVCDLLSQYPEIIDALKEVHESGEILDTPWVEMTILVEQERLFELDQKEKEVVAVTLNGQQLEEEEQDCIANLTRFTAKVTDVSGQKLRIVRKKMKRTSPLVVRRLSSASTVGAEKARSALARARKASLTGGLKKATANLLSPVSNDGKKSVSDSEEPAFEAKVTFAEEVEVSEIPLTGGKTLTNKDLQWRFSWQVGGRAETESDKLRSLYLVLLESRLGGMPATERLAWQGGLDPAREEIWALATFLYGRRDGLDLEAVQARAALQVYGKVPFNNLVVKEAVAKLTSAGEKLEEVAGVRSFLRGMAETLASLEASKVNQAQLAQMSHAVKAIVEVREAAAEEYIAEAFTTRFRDLLRRNVSGRFTSPDLECVTEEVERFVLPTLDLIRERFGAGSDDLAWASIFADAVLDQAVPVVHNVILANSGSADPVLTFGLFCNLRGLLDDVPSGREESYFAVFQPCLPLWTERVKETSRLQVEKVLEMERERHAGQGWESFSDATTGDEEEEEWMLENAAMHVGGIFKSCEVTWKRLNWPNLEENLDFGITLVVNLQVRRKGV